MPNCFTKQELAARADLLKIPAVRTYAIANRPALEEIRRDYCFQRSLPGGVAEVDYVVPEPLPPQINDRARGHFYGVLASLALPIEQGASWQNARDPYAISKLVARLERPEVSQQCVTNLDRRLAGRLMKDPQVRSEMRFARLPGDEKVDIEQACRMMKAAAPQKVDLRPNSPERRIYETARANHRPPGAVLAAMIEQALREAAVPKHAAQ